MVPVAILITMLDSIKSRFYIFDPEQLHGLVRRALIANGQLDEHGREIRSTHVNNTRGVIDYIVADLRRTIGSRYITAKEEWLFSNAGGTMGAVYLIHVSITEYVLVFGTPLGTEGHTGVHWADDYFHILHGEQWAFRAGALDKEVYRVGSVHHLPKGVAKQFKMHRECWGLEYARGWIPSMMPFGLADIFTSTLDLSTFYHSVRIAGREMLGNLLQGKL